MRRMFYCALAAAVLFCGMTVSAKAEQVKVTGVHICCGGCVSGIEEALGETKNISNLEISSKQKTVTFDAKDDAAAIEALKALAAGGYYGKTNHKGPDFKVDPKAEQSTVELSGLHLCCPGCTKGLTEALKAVPTIGDISIDDSEGTAKISAKADSRINLKATLESLHKHGFHATLK